MIKLQTPNSLFQPTVPKTDIRYFRREKLHHFHSHPFRPYTGLRYKNLVESIKEHGILVPLIVRPHKEYESEYEILAGHNRFECGMAAELDDFPCVVMNNLSEEEAMFIVIETNIMQRSFSEMLPSERALCFATKHEAIKRQGKRTDLIKELSEMLNTYNPNENETLTPVATKYNSKEEIGKEHGFSKDTVARYIKINSLIEEFKELLDASKIALRAAYAIAFLKKPEQILLYSIIVSGNYSIDIKKAEKLKALSHGNSFNKESVFEVFQGKRIIKARPTEIKVKWDKVTAYFEEDAEPKEVEETIIKALDYYFENVV